jgi:cell division protein FtsW
MSNLKSTIDRTFLLLVIGVVIFGLAMLTSASSPMGYERFGDSYYFLKHQLFSGVIPGLILLFIFSRISYKKYKKYAFPMLIVSIALLGLVFIPGIGADYGTFANSWVSIGNFAFQPAEIVKLTFLIYLAAWMEQRSHTLKDFNDGLVPFLAILGLITLLMILQPDLGTLAVIAFMAFVVYFIAGGPISFLIGIGAVGSVAFWVMIKSSPYRAARLMTFLHPELDPQGIGYQINQALLAIGSGGIFGRGYGHSLQKFQYLPEVAGDSIFAVMGEELGFAFTVVFLCVFLYMLLRGLKIAQGAKDAFGKYLVVGIIAWFGAQAFFNIGSMVGLLPITGVPLPFLSYGGTSLVISLAAVGVILSVSRESKIS